MAQKEAAPASWRDGIGQAAQAISGAMTAPDAAPVLPVLTQLHQTLVGVIQHGHLQQQSQPGPGAAGPAMGSQGQAPGPAASPYPAAGGQGMFPNSPQPNAEELRRLVGSQAGR